MMRNVGGFKVIRAEGRERRDFGWLRASWLFSFDDYYDPDNQGFGALRAFNDDTVAPGSGFSMHHHAETEIVTFVLSGELAHRDTAGHDGAIAAHEVQRMSAGTGIDHSEFNSGPEPVHFYQMWFLPNQGHLRPEYQQRSFSPEAMRNRLLPLASGEGAKGAVPMHADATLYGSSLERGRSIELDANGRKVFIYITDGELTIGGTTLRSEDQARINGDDVLRMRATTDTDLVLVDMPSYAGG